MQEAFHLMQPSSWVMLIYGGLEGGVLGRYRCTAAGKKLSLIRAWLLMKRSSLKRTMPVFVGIAGR